MLLLVQMEGILTASNDKTARLSEVKTRGPSSHFLSIYERVNYAEFSPDGQTVVTASQDKTARLWDVKTGKQLVLFKGHENNIEHVLFSPNGQRSSYSIR